LEGFQNPNTMIYADTVLKDLGREKAAEKYKVGYNLTNFMIFLL